MQVKWDKRAMKRLDKATEYGLYKFGEITSIRFYQKIRSYDSLLAEHPRLGKVEPLLICRRFEYRSLVVHEHYKLIYYINEVKGRIVVADFWDVRQEPQHLAEEV